jgi:inner membrane protein
MPTVMTHAMVGITAGIVTPFRVRRPAFWIASAVLPVLPDLDVIGLPLGVPFLSMWGHRGISHSLAAALVIGAATAALLHRRGEAQALPLGLYFALVIASHGVLDALTDGGPGVAFFAPFDTTRYFFGWRPLPVSPLAGHFFSEWGWRVLRAEVALVWVPAVAVATVALSVRRWPRR